MGRRILIGHVATRSEAQIYEQILRSAGVPAVSELGSALSEFADVASSAIYIDEKELNRETAQAILAVLGNSANRDALEPYLKDVVRAEPGMVSVAWFETHALASEARDALKAEGLRCDVRELPWEVSPYEGRPFGLFLPSKDLDLHAAQVIWSLVGDNADTEVLSPYRRFPTEG